MTQAEQTSAFAALLFCLCGEDTPEAEKVKELIR